MPCSLLRAVDTLHAQTRTVLALPRVHRNRTRGGGPGGDHDESDGGCRAPARPLAGHALRRLVPAASEHGHARPVGRRVASHQPQLHHPHCARCRPGGGSDGSGRWFRLRRNQAGGSTSRCTTLTTVSIRAPRGRGSQLGNRGLSVFSEPELPGTARDPPQPDRSTRPRRSNPTRRRRR